jgi:hypothetical protein
MRPSGGGAAEAERQVGRGEPAGGEERREPADVGPLDSANLVHPDCGALGRAEDPFPFEPDAGCVRAVVEN